MTEFIVPLTAAAAVDAERVGPKAANLAALAHAGLPTPGGFCLSADAYRAQIATLGLEPMVRHFAAADVVEERRLAVEIRLRPDRRQERRQFRRPVRELSRHR